MEGALSLLRQPEWRLMDQSVAGIYFSALQSFGTDDALCHSIGSGRAPATVRTWVHDQTVVLGIQDTKLPDLQTGIHFLTGQGYKVIVRNSGGLAVVLDEGVLNISLILPEKDKAIEINRGYETMRQLIQNMFADDHGEIAAGEIAGSYCPGSYDLSIGGKKFAGISQRRLKKGAAIQLYLCVNGSGTKRARLIKQFYEIAKAKEAAKMVYPAVVPEVMASLSELLGEPLSISDVMLRLLNQLKANSDYLHNGSFNEYELGIFPGYYERVVERNHKIMEI